MMPFMSTVEKKVNYYIPDINISAQTNIIVNLLNHNRILIWR